MAYITPHDIYNKTNGGLDIILQYYPQAANVLNTPGKRFKMRGDERTASAAIKRGEDGVYIITDFGGDAKARNAISVVMDEEKINFRTAILTLAERLQIVPPAMAPDALKAKFTKTPAPPNTPIGQYDVTTKDFTINEIKHLFTANVFDHNKPAPTPQTSVILETWEQTRLIELSALCSKYHLHSVAHYSFYKHATDTNGNSTGTIEHIKIESTDTYPIYCFIETDFKKIYQPLALDKSRRFIYIGRPTKDFIFGLQQAQQHYNKLNADTAEADYDSLPDEEKTASRAIKKLPEIIIATGGSDALNLAAIGYYPIWFNSESTIMHQGQYTTIARICDKVYNVPDIDDTGKKQAHKLALAYLDVHTVELPPTLADKTYFGKPCKDVRDFLKWHTAREFADLLTIALPYKFWAETYKLNTKTGKPYLAEYEVQNTCLYNFLQKSGYHIYIDENEKESETFIHIDSTGAVRKVLPTEIKRYLFDFLKERRQPVKLRDVFYRSAQLSESSFKSLEPRKVDFKCSTAGSQYLFFTNTTWHVTKDTITTHKPIDKPLNIWLDEIIPHSPKLLDKPFTVTYQPEADTYDIAIHNPQCIFLQYLCRTSAMYWQKAATGQLLTPEESTEEKTHLINKLYTFGYLLHRHKSPSRAWMPFIMENKISEDGVSEGGAGKSIFAKAVSHFCRTVFINGREKKINENKHLFENVTRHTKYVLLEDIDKYFDLGMLFEYITGIFSVNPKHSRSFTLGYADSPKLAVTTNFGMRNEDPAKNRRVLYCSFSDYYHNGGPGLSHSTAFSPLDDFGKNLFDDFTTDEWNHFFNTAAYALQLYLNFPKINPPLDNVQKRNMMETMGPEFRAWANSYFAHTEAEADRKLDTFLVRKEVFDAYREVDKNSSPQLFFKKLTAWCRFKSYELNPKALHNSDDRIVRRVAGKSTEMLYILTAANINPTHITDNNTQDTPF